MTYLQFSLLDHYSKTRTRKQEDQKANDIKYSLILPISKGRRCYFILRVTATNLTLFIHTNSTDARSVISGHATLRQYLALQAASLVAAYRIVPRTSSRVGQVFHPS